MIQVEIQALSLTAGRVTQTIACDEFMGLGMKPLRIARALASADFFTPTLLPSPSELRLKWGS